MPGFHSRNAGFIGDVGERAVAIVVIKDIASELGDKEIGEAVVVVVAPNAAEAIAGAGDAGFVGDVGERAVAVVVIKRVRTEIPRLYESRPFTK